MTDFSLSPAWCPSDHTTISIHYPIHYQYCQNMFPYLGTFPQIFNAKVNRDIISAGDHFLMLFHLHIQEIRHERYPYFFANKQKIAYSLDFSKIARMELDQLDTY